MSMHLVEAAIRRFAAPSLWALVIGDLMLDRYLHGDVERISPEAPVPVVVLSRETECAGGAANVAANLAGLCMRTRLIGCIGDDDDGAKLERAIAAMGISTEGLHRSTTHPTIVKTRVLGGHQQMLRLDRERREPHAAADGEALLACALRQFNDNPTVIVLSDYAKGVLSPQLCQAVIAEARRRNIPVLVDPKGADYSKYAMATALTPNKRETAEACGVAPLDSAHLLEAAAALQSRLQLDFLAVTRSEEGISLIADGHVTDLPAVARQVFDVSGAGDTVIATLAAGLAVGLEREEALYLANVAAGIVVGKLGTVPITRLELLNELMLEDSMLQISKIGNLNTVRDKVSQWRAAGQRIVFTNGCFDLLHAGHVTYLEQARKLGDRLVLGLNTDRSVSALKGPSRPVVHENDRARVLAALEAVDAVVLFDEETPLLLIKALRPDVLVKGADYREEQVVGGSEVKSWGGEIALIDMVPGRSSSAIIERLRVSNSS
ncbi:D-glycero-beta-D-manno-heptose-7-phosphate kinase [Candidatus Methylospira mobilis]|uniref:Bifunctional protein HldE n=1 Tax=Candidatus Methylospira mobilis TaxID=1808979 RepID=A0A5Q0BI25_9GAMM|nr:D-glycero-beta-D-manno-heptose-7-phosphate kinase [Candidatus Methylospira mobilis]QFY41817.1 D-glycero-beta-D-manno-heptose-7-phosphate kinase [Candidatus Methylospira mobilis]